MTSVSLSSAGCCIGQKLYISLSAGTTIIPPGCCPVVLLIPVHPIVNLSTSACGTTIPLSSKYFFTYP